MAYETDLRQPAFKLGPMLVTPSRNRIGQGGASVTVAPKVMHLLCTLAARPGETLSREALIETVWDGVIVSDAAIDRAVCNLRKALGDDARCPRYVETIRKRGIRLMVAVEPAKPAAPKPLAKGRGWRAMTGFGLGGGAAAAMLVWPIALAPQEGSPEPDVAAAVLSVAPASRPLPVAWAVEDDCEKAPSRYPPAPERRPI